MTEQKRFKTIVAPTTPPVLGATTCKAAIRTPDPVQPPTVPTKHVFESALLGKAPYRFLGVTRQASSCQYCNTPIIFKFWLESADDKRFFVGSDCIFKSGDADLRRVVEPIVKQHQKELRDERERGYIAKFDAYLTSHPNHWKSISGPHPFRWMAQQGKTLGDYQEYCYRHSGQANKAKIARNILIGLGLVKPTRKAKDV